MLLVPMPLDDSREYKPSQVFNKGETVEVIRQASMLYKFSNSPLIFNAMT